MKITSEKKEKSVNATKINVINLVAILEIAYFIHSVLYIMKYVFIICIHLYYI